MTYTGYIFAGMADGFRTMLETAIQHPLLVITVIILAVMYAVVKRRHI